MKAGYGGKDAMRAKAVGMIEKGVMDLGAGKIGAPTAPRNANAVRQERNTARMDKVNPAPVGYAKGGAVKMAAGGAAKERKGFPNVPRSKLSQSM